MSELTSCLEEGEDLSKYISISEIENYYKDQCENNNYKKSLEQFIEEYGLTIDFWLVNNNVDLTGSELPRT